MWWPILQWCFCSVRSPCITEVLHWRHPYHWEETELLWKFGVSTCTVLQYLQSYLELFICHLAAAMPLLKTDNISQVCRYIIETWPVLMSCTWKNHSLLAAFWDKISIFHYWSKWLTGQVGWKLRHRPCHPDSIPGTSQPRQKSGVGQESTNFWKFKAWRFNPILNKQIKLHF